MDWDEECRLDEERDKAGLVACDRKCPAKDSPYTREEYVLAYEHWRYHGYLHGCSHGA